MCVTGEQIKEEENSLCDYLTLCDSVMEKMPKFEVSCHDNDDHLEEPAAYKV